MASNPVRIAALISALMLSGCSDDADLTDGPATPGTAEATTIFVPPATPPSTIAPIDFTQEALRLNVPACQIGECEVVAQVAGLPSVGGDVAVATVRNTRPDSTTDNVVVFNRSGELLWTAPAPIPASPGTTPQLALDSSGNVLIPVDLPSGSRVYAVGVAAKEVKDFNSFAADSPFISEGPANITDSDGDGFREIRVTKGESSTLYHWRGGVYLPLSGGLPR